MQESSLYGLPPITQTRSLKVKKKMLTLFVCLLGTLTLQAQVISGVVKDNSSEPIIGVSVIIENTTTGTFTDIDGRYSLNAKPGDILVFSFVGMVTQKITVGK